MMFVIVSASFFASLLTLYSGFGLGTLLMPVAAAFFPVATAVALTAFVHLFNNLFKLGTLRRDIHWQVTFKFGVPALVASIPGALLLTSLSGLDEIATYEVIGIEAVVTPIKLLVGLLLIVFAFVEWFSLVSKKHIGPSHLFLGGVLSGFFGGLSGHQGAFRSAFLLHAGLNTKQFVATSAAIASFVDIARLVVYGLNLSLVMDTVDIQLLVAATVAAFAGVLAGRSVMHKVTIGLVQKLVACMLLILGSLLAAGIL